MSANEECSLCAESASVTVSLLLITTSKNSVRPHSLKLQLKISSSFALYFVFSFQRSVFPVLWTHSDETSFFLRLKLRDASIPPSDCGSLFACFNSCFQDLPILLPLGCHSTKASCFYKHCMPVVVHPQLLELCWTTPVFQLVAG